jgi:isopenicillin N synthase-like dioxygenase
VLLPDRDRISMPLFLDPAWDAVVSPLPGHEPERHRVAARPAGRWDDVSVFDGPAVYGDYLLAKVARVFPDLYREVMGS